MALEYDRLVFPSRDRQARVPVLVRRAAGHPVAAVLADAVQLAEYQLKGFIVHDSRFGISNRKERALV